MKESVCVVLLQGGERARSSRFYPDGKLLEYCYEDARTLYQIMHRGAKLSGESNLFIPLYCIARLLQLVPQVCKCHSLELVS